MSSTTTLEPSHTSCAENERPEARSKMTTRPDLGRQPSKFPKYRAGRAFCITLALGLLFAICAFRAHLSSEDGISFSPGKILQARDPGGLDAPRFVTRGSEDVCRNVNKVRLADQCAYIRENCPADEGGFTAYLELYYCRLAKAKPVAFIILMVWLGLLFSTIGIAASDFFCENLETISVILGLSENVAGVTFVAFGNGSPDVFSTFAAMNADSGTLAVGELFGAAGFITAVVAGSMALIQTFHMSRSDFLRDTGFFTVAAAFSIYFLWDGKLHLWECLAMVGFYIFYVVVVLVMGWYKARRRAKKLKDLAAREHFGDVADDDDHYHDDPQPPRFSRQSSIVRGVTDEDWSALERATGQQYAGEDDAEADEERDRLVISEVQNEMRLSKPAGRNRRSTVTPIRPSLVGALEFQAVLKSLTKSQNYQTIPLNSRRFSDDPLASTSDRLSTASDPASRPPYKVAVNEHNSPELQRSNTGGLKVPSAGLSGRTRAVSANDAAGLHIDSAMQQMAREQGRGSQIDEQRVDAASEDDFALESASSLYASSFIDGQQSSPAVHIQPATPRRELPPEMNVAADEPSSNLLEPPSSRTNTPQLVNQLGPSVPHAKDSHSGKRSSPRAPQSRELPKIVIPDEEDDNRSSRAPSPFPQYRDSPSPTISGGTRSTMSTRPPSLYLPGPLAPVSSPDALASDQSTDTVIPRTPLRWWPYSILPPPRVILHTLFPTFKQWSDRSWWAKCIGLSAMPSILLLTLTLPVVSADEIVTADDETAVVHNLATSTTDAKRSLGRSQVPGPQPSPAVNEHLGNGALPATVGGQHQMDHEALESAGAGARLPPPHYEERAAPQIWNRWLLIIQLFTAPQFCLLAVWNQSPSDLSMTWIIRSVLICLLISMILLIPVLLFTTPTYRPKVFNIILSNVGFIVSVAWISTIASQVVGGLQALAVICNMSHAIMGLTIFAVGNSLGDLVANVTLAQLGRPVMALSACIGGPLLNILLGIGLSGTYLLVRGAEKRHAKHPGDDLKFKAYHIEVERTLIISGFTLLLTLLGLMIAVPLNRFKFGKGIGYSLIAVWVISTVVNVAIELSGLNKWNHKHSV